MSVKLSSNLCKFSDNEEVLAEKNADLFTIHICYCLCILSCFCKEFYFNVLA